MRGARRSFLRVLRVQSFLQLPESASAKLVIIFIAPRPKRDDAFFVLEPLRCVLLSTVRIHWSF